MDFVRMLFKWQRMTSRSCVLTKHLSLTIRAPTVAISQSSDLSSSSICTVFRHRSYLALTWSYILQNSIERRLKKDLHTSHRPYVP